MQEVGTEVSNTLKQRRPMRRWVKVLLWIAAVLLVTAGVLAAVATYYLRRAEPMLRAALIEALQKRFHARVELDDFRVSVLDGFWVESRGLRVWLPVEAQQHAIAENNAADQPWITGPWIVADKLRFHAVWRMIPGEPIVIQVIHVEGVKVLLPPKEDRPHFSMGKGTNQQQASPQPTPAATAGQPNLQPVTPQTPPPPMGGMLTMPKIEVRRIECQNIDLVIEKGKEARAKGKIPLDFALTKVILTPDGKGGPIAFSVEMTNPKPIGLIHSTGHAGPWVPGDPGEMPVDGDYHFDHADLSTIKGIAGMLSSTGHYHGTLRRIEADGQTTTPDFRLERIGDGPGVPLNTRFHAIVDGTSGDTWLDPVDAMLGHTHFVARGKVVRVPKPDGSGYHGHDVTLQVTMDHGRIEDILHISASAETAFMSGNLSLTTAFHLPPSPPDQQISVWDRLALDGNFHLSQVRFSSDKIQGRLEQLSLRGQGKPSEVKTTDPTTILSEMQGHFTLANGLLQTPDLNYQVPGAQILVQGKYGLQGGTLDFVGNARLDARLSQVVGGWKGFLLKPADHFLSKNGAGTDVPIHLEGTRKSPKFGVDMGRIGKEDAVPQK